MIVATTAPVEAHLDPRDGLHPAMLAPMPALDRRPALALYRPALALYRPAVLLCRPGVPPLLVPGATLLAHSPTLRANRPAFYGPWSRTAPVPGHPAARGSSVAIV